MRSHFVRVCILCSLSTALNKWYILSSVWYSQWIGPAIFFLKPSTVWFSFLIQINHLFITVFSLWRGELLIFSWWDWFSSDLFSVTCVVSPSWNHYRLLRNHTIWRHTVHVSTYGDVLRFIADVEGFYLSYIFLLFFFFLKAAYKRNLQERNQGTLQGKQHTVGFKTFWRNLLWTPLGVSLFNNQVSLTLALSSRMLCSS